MQKDSSTFDSSESLPLVFSWNRNKKRVVLNFMPTPQEVVIGVKFSFDLAKLLGFQGQRRYTATVTAESAPDLFSSLNSVYVYCDLVEAVLVGDTKVPLLRIVTHSGLGEEREQCAQSFESCAVSAVAEKEFRYC